MACGTTSAEKKLSGKIKSLKSSNLTLSAGRVFTQWYEISSQLNFYAKGFNIWIDEKDGISSPVYQFLKKALRQAYRELKKKDIIIRVSDKSNTNKSSISTTKTNLKKKTLQKHH